MIGDIHADAKALLFILNESGAITQNGKLTNKFNDIIFVGDLVGKGKQNLEVMDIIIELEARAKKNNGPRIRSLLGNHEVRMLAGDDKYISKSDLKRMKNMEIKSFDAAFSADGKYGKWLLSLNTMEAIGPDLISHAGFGNNELELEPQEINKMVRAWLEFFLEVGPQPPEETAWIIGLKPNKKTIKFHGTGPIWTQAMANSKKKRKRMEDEKLRPSEVENYLNEKGFDNVILGHNPTPTDDIILEHKKFGNRVILIDSGISSSMNGNLTALTRINGELIPNKWTRPEAYPKWIKKLRTQITDISLDVAIKCSASFIALTK